MSSYVELFQVEKIYAGSRGGTPVVQDFNLTMRQGEFVSLIGHSGCGKSTVLGMVSGLSSVTSGVSTCRCDPPSNAAL